MIRVTIYKNEKHQCVGFKAHGHAGFSEEGNKGKSSDGNNKYTYCINNRNYSVR